MTAYRTLLVALAAVVAAAFAHLALAGRVDGDLLTFVRVTDHAEVLNGRLANYQQFSGGKRQATVDLIAGRITLPQAVERFRELHALVEDGNGRDGIYPFRLASDEEALWHSVLVWVEAQLRPRTDSGASEVLARLRAEYRERFGHDPGPVKAPGL
jgi:hypothetical protein